jgi:hypothetical protein
MPSIALTRADAPVDVGSSSIKARGGQGVRDQMGPEAAVSQWRRSVLGPCDIGNRWSPVGATGQGRHTTTAGHMAFGSTTLDGDAA